MVFLLGGFGGTELFIIFLIILLLFGSSAIPKIARSLGKAKKEFSNAKKDFEKGLLEEEKQEEKEEVKLVEKGENIVSRSDKEKS